MDVLSTILAMGGSSFLLGFLVGLFIRALSKVLALISGAFLLGVLLLSYYGVVTINYDALANMIYSAFAYLGSVTVGITTIPFFTGLAVGWAVAPRRGRRVDDSYV